MTVRAGSKAAKGGPRRLTKRTQTWWCWDGLHLPEPKNVAPAVLLGLLPACGTVQPAAAPAAAHAPRAVIASIPIESGPTLLAISPDGSTVYATSMGKLTAIRTDTNEVVASGRIDPYTTGIAVTRDGGRILLVAA